ncbi:MAG: IdeS/Mac family cysteine endopeptidase [Treponema sp.]
MIKKYKLIAFILSAIFLLISCKNNYIRETKQVVSVTSISLIPDEDNISLVKGAHYKLNANVKPDNASDKKLTFESSVVTVASVNNEGLISTHNVGTSQITIKAANGILKNVMLTVTAAHIPVKKIIVPPEQNTISIVNGDSLQIRAQVVPDNASNKKLTFESSVVTVASVNNEGLISTHNVGTSQITIKAANGILKNVMLTVTAAHIPVKKIIVPPEQNTISIVNGDSLQIRAQVVPDNASDRKLTYVSDKELVAFVNDKGVITARSVGSANITITAGGISKTIKVIVTAARIPVTSIVFTPAITTKPIELVIGQVYKLNVKAMPEDATNRKLKFETSNDLLTLLMADDKSEVKADGVGDSMITITSEDNPTVSEVVHFKIKPKPSIKIKTESLISESNGGKLTFIIETLNGKLEYTPLVVGGGTKWMSVDSKVSMNDNEDIVHLNVSKNNTIWDRTAYIKFKGDDNKYIKGSDDKELEVKLTQKKNENPNITIKWVYGITPPKEKEKSPVEIPHVNPPSYHKMPYVFYWYENEHTKFFNTRKMRPTKSFSGTFTDSHQCWAKSASNMLHWWFEQNEDNIKKYIEKKGIKKEDDVEKYNMYKPFYKRGLLNEQENEKSSIANVFRTKCLDDPQGSWIFNGLKWYLFGMKNFARDKNYSPELFKDVFDVEEGNNPIYAKHTYTKKEFEEVLKEALAPNSKKAIGVHIHDNSSYGHAITLWGAAFDEDQNVIAIYVCDNNFEPNRIFTYGIYYQKDIYADYNEDVRIWPYLINYTINQALKNRYVGTLITLDKGETQWQRWFDAQ